MIQLGGVQIPLLFLPGSVVALICFGIGFARWFSIRQNLQKALVADGEIIRNTPGWEIQGRFPTKAYHLSVKYFDEQGQVKFIKSQWRTGRETTTQLGATTSKAWF